MSNNDKSPLNVFLSERFGPLLENKSRYLVMYGGRGSGKSECAGRKIVKRCWNEGNHKVLIVRKVRRSMKDSAIRVMLQILEDGEIAYDYNRSDLVIRFLGRGSRPNELLFYGLDDREKLKSLKGITMVWIEEPTELTREDFMHIDLIFREPTVFYKQIMMSFNPDAALAPWLRDMFFGEKPDGYTGPGTKEGSYLHHSTIDDNPIAEVRDEYHRVLDDLGDPTYTAIYLHGHWAAAKGLIFGHWKEEPLPSLDEDWFDEIINGIDFGYSIDPAAYVKIYRKALDFWLEELIYETGLTNQQFADKIKAHPKADPQAVTYCDSAEPKSIQELKDAGINAVESIKGKDSVRFGIDLLLSLKIAIVEGTSPNLIKEKRLYKRKIDKDGNPMPEPVSFMNHAIDGSRYAIYTHYLKYLRSGTKSIQIYYRGMPKPQVARPSDEDREAQIRASIERSRQPPPDEEEIREEKTATLAVETAKQKKGDTHGRKTNKVHVPW